MCHDPLDRLTRTLVEHVRDSFAGYPDVDLTVATEDGQFRDWLETGARAPGAVAVGVCTRQDLTGPLLHAVEEVRRGGAVLVVCDVGSTTPLDVVALRGVDLVEVRRASEIAGAVAESTAGDVPLVVDVRLEGADVTDVARGRS
ncbi:hypothetical protein [Kineococcus rhizosphaerae]|uniref:Uncharacterized protein n=1 Tax=Kineococcus rhizosphaerae TaxID=559628 RepID=A0A2T0RAP1_9ACTN|nr:hypothetical protein [Kineococcus rhizosphaerae]PRY18236.1 hypothetical protein CLV37_101481 [Kineococcus rhizosphaerae]